ncbi:MAG: hypothetical protein LBD73_01535 [Deferribacteraceae bacterium]|jgi:hypothetical protein|nr:hypothetical protein [Deferribacteraceae bacterium]
MKLSSRRGLLIAVVFGLLLAACSREKPDASVTGFLDALQKGDLKGAEEYIDASLFSGVEGDETFFLQLYFKSLTYEKPIIEAIENDRASVGVTITALDLGLIMAEYINAISRKAAADKKRLGEYSEDELNNMLLDMLKDPAGPKKTVKITFELTRHKNQGNKWILSANEQLRSGIFMRSTAHIYESADPYSEDDGALSQDISASATLQGIDANAGICRFVINQTPLSIRCAPEYAEYLKDRIGATFPILYRADAESGEKDAYFLVGFE